MNIPKMLTIKETAKEFTLPEHYIRTLCKEKKICAVQAGNKWLVNADALCSYLSTPPTPQPQEQPQGIRRIAE